MRSMRTQASVDWATAAMYWVRALISVRWASSTSMKLNLPISKPRVAVSTAFCAAGRITWLNDCTSLLAVLH